MATAAPEWVWSRLWPAAALWVAVGAWAFHRLPPDGSAGALLALMWAAMLALRALPWGRWGWSAPRLAGLCCPAPQVRWSDVAMGWMMGTLWWHADGCLAMAGPVGSGVALHLTAMAVLALGVRRARQRAARAWPEPLGRSALYLGAGTAALGLGAGALQGWLALIAMACLTLAWASEPVSRRAEPSASLRSGLIALAGPLGLWLILWRWPTVGPDALWQAIGVLGLVAWLGQSLALPARLAQPLNSGGSA